MTRVAIHVSVGIRSATVREEVHNLVDSLLMGRKVVPEHGSILQVCLRISLLSMDEEGKLGGIAEKEDGGVVVNPIPVTLFSIELDGETTRIAGSIRGALLTTDG